MIDPILLDLPATIETERLLLRPPREGDGPLLFAAVSESLPELRRFLASLPWVAVEQTLESSEAYCRTAQSNFIARKDLPFLIFERATGQLLGATGLHRMAWATPKAEFGYWGRTARAQWLHHRGRNCSDEFRVHASSRSKGRTPYGLRERRSSKACGALPVRTRRHTSQ